MSDDRLDATQRPQTADVPKNGPRTDASLALRVTVCRGPSVVRMGDVFVVANGDVIGRSTDADVQVPHPSVSRRHARAQRDARGWCLTNLSSRNVVMLDGAAVPPGSTRHVSDGAGQLVLGGLQFELFAIDATTDLPSAGIDDRTPLPGELATPPLLSVVRDGGAATAYCKGRYLPLKPLAAVTLYALCAAPGEAVHLWDIEELAGRPFQAPQAVSELRRTIAEQVASGWLTRQELIEAMTPVTPPAAAAALSDLDTRELLRRLIVARRGIGYMLLADPRYVAADTNG